jgi:hypothetical protein
MTGIVLQPRKNQILFITKHFFGRFFDSEMLSAFQAEMHLLFVHVLGLLIVPGFYKVSISIYKYSYLAWLPVARRNQEVFADMHFFLCLSMILTGLITVFEWDTLFPDQKDFVNLTPLPIEPKILFFAKVLALALFVVLCNVAINGLPTLLFPGIVLAKSIVPGSAGMTLQPFEGNRYMAAQAVSLFLSSIFVFTSLATVRAVLLLSLPAKLVRLASRCVQLPLIFILFCALFTFPFVNTDRLITEGKSAVGLLPQFWFLGLFENLIGHHSLINSSLAKTACIAVTVSFFVSMAAYRVSYRSSMQKGFQSGSSANFSVSRIQKICAWILNKILLRKSMEGAYFHFILQTVLRRQEHMLYLGSFVAAGVATIYLCLYSMKSGLIPDLFRHLNILMSFPLILSFFILAGLRFTFTIPADLNANWIFKITDRQRLVRAFGGVYKFMLCAVFIPLLIIFPPCYLMFWDPIRVLYHMIFVTLLSLILIELLLFRFMKLPFTCSYLPGKANLKLYGWFYVLACIVYSYGMTVIESWILKDMKLYLVSVFILGIVVFTLKRLRILMLKRNCEIQFEAEPADQLNILAIE